MKKIISMLLSIAMLMQICSVAVWSVNTEDILGSGICGENLTWSLTEDGTLTISGSGAMDDYVFDEDTWIINSPWDADYAFDIFRIVIEEGVTSIGQFAFARLPVVETVQIANSVTEISDHAFAEIESTIFFFDGDAPTFAENALEECYNLTLIYKADTEDWDRYFSASEGMQMELFGGSVNWKSVDEDGIIASGNCGTDADSDYEPDDNLTWTLHLDGTLNVEGSGDLCYGWFEESMTGWESKYSSCIRKVILPEGLTGISGNTFSYCRQLEDIQIPAAVTSIGSGAFAECLNLREITFTGDAPAIFNEEDSPVFDGVTATVYYPDNNPTWTEEVRQNYGGTLTWVAKEMEGSEGDSGEETVISGICGENLTWTLENGVLTISGEGAMYNYNMYDKHVPWDVSLIEQVLFTENCTITYIGEHTFANCVQLEKAEIPKTVTEIGYGAFYGCTSLNSVTLPDNLTVIDGMAFVACSNLTEMIIPASVSYIGERAFAFGAMTTVRMLGDEPELGYGVFDGSTITTYAPWSSHVSDQWGTIIPVVPSDTTPPVLEVIGPANGSVLTNLYATFDVTASDANGVVSVEMSYPKGEDTITVKDEPFEIHLTELGDGALVVTFTAKDIAGNTVTQTFNYTVDVYPDAPTNLIASMVSDGIRLTWTEPENNTFNEGYYIYLVEENGNLTYKAYVAKGTSVWTDTDVEYGYTYSYTMVSEASNQMQSEFADVVTIEYVLIDTENPEIIDVWPSSEDKVTFCYEGTVQIAAEDTVGLGRAEIWATIGSNDPVKVGDGFADISGGYVIECDFSALSGEAVLTYLVYDTAGNCTSQTANVTIRPYTAPLVPTQVTVENGFRSVTLNWEYTGDMATLKQFNIYDTAGKKVAAVKNYNYTIRNLSETTVYRVAAEDIYGVQSICAELMVTPVITENESPKAVLPFHELTAVTGTAITFSGAFSTDNDRIESYAWNFGDGLTGDGVNFSHTYTNAGIYTVTLTVTDRSGNSNIAEAYVTVYDTLGEDATHAVLTVNVMDGYRENTPAIEGATVIVSSEGFEVAALTNVAGMAELVLPKGAHTMTVVKNGYGGKVQQIKVLGDENGTASQTVYLAAAGVDVVGGELTVKPMTYDEIVEAGIDVTHPANNHVVKQEITIRFQPTPELQFELPIEQIVDAAGDMLKGEGFGWHTFTTKPNDPDPSEPDHPNTVTPEDWGTPDNYTVGVFPVGDSAYMVIYGQTHWLKEMFNVELIVFNNSYAETITDCVAELQLPEGLSLANLLDRTQTESVYLGEIDSKGTEYSSRTVNWYVRGDAEGDYGLTAMVNGLLNGSPFEKTFTTNKAIHVFAGNALKLTVTLPKSAYAEKDYAVKFSLTNVSDRPIYNLSFGLDSAHQFTAQRMSDGTVGEVEREFSNEDFEDGMTYGLPVLEPGKSFNLILKTNFAYEHQFIEWAIGKVPGLEVGYRVADIFVTTLEGSTTEIPVEIVLEDVKKDTLFQWVWDETIGALKENAKEAVIEFVDDKLFQGIPVVEKGVEFIEVVTNVRDHFTEEEIEYIPTVNVTDGVECVAKNEIDAYLDRFSTYSLRRNTTPGVLVWTNAADAVISDDGKTMTMPNGGELFVLRLGETVAEPEIKVTTYYVDNEGKVNSFSRTLLAAEGMDDNGDPIGGTYISGLKAAKYSLIESLDENTCTVPVCGETTQIVFDGYLVTENGEILLRASNENWSVANVGGEDVEGMTIANGVLTVDSDAKAGVYTVKLSLDGTDCFEQTIVLTNPDNVGNHTLTKTEAVPADCTEDGMKAYWTCTVCSRYYEDADGITEIPDLEAWKSGDGKIAAGHAYGELITDQAAVHTQTELRGPVSAHYFCHVCDTYFTVSKAETTLQNLTGTTPEHDDEDRDHDCDVCGKMMAVCEDKTFDHVCDYGCDKVYGDHIDADKNHTCDYGCSETIGICEDKNLDHVCDYGCGKVYIEETTDGSKPADNNEKYILDIDSIVHDFVSDVVMFHIVGVYDYCRTSLNTFLNQINAVIEDSISSLWDRGVTYVKETVGNMDHAVRQQVESFSEVKQRIPYLK